MKPSPLKISHYFVKSLSVKANPQHEEEKSRKNGNIDIITKVETQQHATNKHNWKVALDVNCQDDNSKSPYLFSVELVGFFQTANDLDDEMCNDIVAANAPAILYSAARELLLLITSRGPFPPFPLPSATFIDETPSAMKRINKEKELAG